MKPMKLEEFKDIDLKKKKGSKHSETALELINEFLASGEAIVEIEESDFDNEFDFSDMKQRNKACGYIRNKLGTEQFKHEAVICAARGNRIFIGNRKDLRPEARTDWWR